MFTVVTSINEKYWNEQFNFNLKSWLKFFPEDCKIRIYTEDNIAFPQDSRLCIFDLYASCPELVEFAQKHKNNPHYNGTKTTKPRMAFKWNAIKFAHKTFPLFHSAENCSGKLIWLDADVLAIQPLTQDFFSNLLESSGGVYYLGRPTVYSECGFVMYDLDNPHVRQFVKEFRDTYRDNNLDDIRETHDSFVFDHIRTNFHEQSIFVDLNKDAKTNKHPFHESALRQCLTHQKGHNKERKQQKFIKRYKLEGL